MDPKGNIFEGKTLDDAVQKGLQSLGLTRAEAMITLMAEGKGGFLGIGARPFRVRVARRPGGPMREPQERPGREGREGRGERRDRNDRGGREGREARAPREGARVEGRGERGRGPRPEQPVEAGAVERPAEPRGERRDRGGRDRGERRGRGGRGDRSMEARGDRGDRADRGGRGPERGGEREAMPPRAPMPPQEPGEGRGDEPSAQHGRRPQRGRRGERPSRPVAEERPPMSEAIEPAAMMPPMRGSVEERQPGVGARGFEDRRRPGDRREDEGDPPRGSDDRRAGGDRRQESPEFAAGGSEGEDALRKRRRRGRRGGRRRRREDEEHAPMTGAAPMTGEMTEQTFEPAEREPVAMAAVGGHAMDFHEAEGPMQPLESHEPHDEGGAFEPATPQAEARTFEDRGPRGLREDRGRGDRPPRRDRDRDDRPREDRPRRSDGPGVPNDVLRDDAVRKATELFKVMGFEAKVTGTAADDRVDLQVEVADNEELLTGRKGETREALQHILNRMVNMGDRGHAHLQLEINDFWQRREVELAEMARQMANDAVASGTEQVTGWLNSQERRIIHVTLREDTRVRTTSIGDGMIKRLGVAPADSAESPGEES